MVIDPWLNGPLAALSLTVHGLLRLTVCRRRLMVARCEAKLMAGIFCDLRQRARQVHCQLHLLSSFTMMHLPRPPAAVMTHVGRVFV